MADVCSRETVRVRLRSVGMLLGASIALGLGSASADAATRTALTPTSFPGAHIAPGFTKIAEGFVFVRHAATRGLPDLVLGSYQGRRPHTIDFSGDAGNIVGNLRWSSWTRSHAAGAGKSVIQGCVPDCATGAQILVPTSITLQRPVDGHFARIIERRDGQDETFLYTRSPSRGTWPQIERSPHPAGPVVGAE